MRYPSITEIMLVIPVNDECYIMMIETSQNFTCPCEKYHIEVMYHHREYLTW